MNTLPSLIVRAQVRCVYVCVCLLSVCLQRQLEAWRSAAALITSCPLVPHSALAQQHSNTGDGMSHGCALGTVDSSTARGRVANEPYQPISLTLSILLLCREWRSTTQRNNFQ